MVLYRAYVEQRQTPFWRRTKRHERTEKKEGVRE